MMLSLVLLSIIADPVPIDKVAHFGLSYAATHSCQVVVKKVFNASKLTSTIACATAVATAGVAKELIDPSIGGERDAKDLMADVAGIGLAVTVISIDW